ncbi:MAG TPA: DUF4386 family protein [Pseudolysinimonas sp.]|jgi:hypothetical protein|nr:DUF4386 family protein [Pseudolysinimonas sp.]
MNPILPWALILLPIVFNLFYAALIVRFSYPGILRQPTAEVLERFSAGGSGLILLWWGFAMSAVAFVPVAILAGALVEDELLRTAVVAVGVLAGLVQALGLLRWVFLVPHLARESAAGADAKTIDLVFQSFHRYLGVAVGEHLGYLSTGAFTILLSAGAWTLLPLWLTIPGIVIGAMLAVGALEFVGPFEREGWKVAGFLVPVGYTLWSVWLLVTGVVLLVAA